MAGIVAARIPLLIALALGAAAMPASATDGDVRSVAGMVNHDRVLLVFAPSLADQRLAVQRRTFAHFAPGAATRDLVLVQVAEDRVIGAHDDAAKLRQRFSVPGSAYRTLLIGKDGHVAFDQPAPVDEATIRNLIDAMPARQEELRRVRAGLGKSGD